MKKRVIIVALIALSPCLAFGQNGFIGLFSDSPTYTNCELIDAPPRLHHIYVVHKYAPGTMGSRFMVTSGVGVTMVYVNETSPFPLVVGNSRTGVCIEYVDCLGSEILILTINYFGVGTSSVCSYLEVVADPSSPTGTVEIMNCRGEREIATGGRLFVNNDGTCPCWAARTPGNVTGSRPP